MELLRFKGKQVLLAQSLPYEILCVMHKCTHDTVCATTTHHFQPKLNHNFTQTPTHP